VEQGIVRKSGAWYTYEGDQLGQGKENARNFLRENPDVANEIEKRIKEKLGVGARLDADAQAEAVKGNGSAPGVSAPGVSAAGAGASGGSAASGARPNGSAANGASARAAAIVPGATV
jgi:recombination protein RecA